MMVVFLVLWESALKTEYMAGKDRRKSVTLSLSYPGNCRIQVKYVAPD